MSNKKEITLEWIKKPAGRKFLEKNAARLVFIKSNHGIWMEDGCGYTDSYDRAGIYTLNEAYEDTAHCGPEKWVRYLFLQEGEIMRMISRVNDRLSYLIKKAQP